MMQIFGAVLLLACTPRSPAPPAAAPAEPVEAEAPEPPPAPTTPIQAYVLIDGSCHWASLHPSTGEPITAVNVPSTLCPDRALLTQSETGATLMSVEFDEGHSKSLWLQETGTDAPVALPELPHMEMAWFEGETVHAKTFGLKADEVIGETVEPAPDHQYTQEEIDAQWIHNCYTYALSEGAWTPVAEEEIQLSEGADRPFCSYGEIAFLSSVHWYSDAIFGSYFDLGVPTTADPMLGTSWLIVMDMDATSTGKPCAQDCPEGTDLLRRYAFETYWFEGRRLSGGVISVSGEPGASWALLEGLEGNLEEFFLADDHLVVCTDKGFGGWDHAAGTRSWWRDSPGCPVR